MPLVEANNEGPLKSCIKRRFSTYLFIATEIFLTDTDICYKVTVKNNLVYTRLISFALKGFKIKKAYCTTSLHFKRMMKVLKTSIWLCTIIELHTYNSTTRSHCHYSPATYIYKKSNNLRCSARNVEINIFVLMYCMRVNILIK